MAVDSLDIWKQTLEALPKVGDVSWALNFAAWAAERVNNKIETDPTSLDSSAGFTFVFNEPVFAGALAALPPTPSQALGIAGFAAAWETAILTTIFPATLNVAAGAFIPPQSNATLFSAVNSVLLDPPSIVAGKAKIMELVSAPPAGSGLDSQFAEKFREAFLELTITVVGLDSTPPPAGPLPLTAALVPLI